MKKYFHSYKEIQKLLINASVHIPNGCYCYNERGICPFWKIDINKPEQLNGYCYFLNKGDWMENSRGFLWDQIKECKINDPDVEIEKNILDIFEKCTTLHDNIGE